MGGGQKINMSFNGARTQEGSQLTASVIRDVILIFAFCMPMMALVETNVRRIMKKPFPSNRFTDHTNIFTYNNYLK
jgi:hypothetical protein